MSICVKLWLLTLLLPLGSKAATAPVLSINLTLQDRQFLIANNQIISIVLPSPASDSNANVTVALTLRPIANLTRIAFDAAPVLYLAYAPIGSFDTIQMTLQSPATYGQAYSFDGAGINGDGTGVDGAISIYYSAPQADAAPLIVGVAGYVYDVAAGKPAQPSPLNYYGLNRYETRLIPQTAPVAWVFVSTNLNVGSVLPIALLKPVPPLTAAPHGGRSQTGQVVPTLQIGRYLPVQLDGDAQATIYFNISGNAFAYAANPTN